MQTSDHDVGSAFGASVSKAESRGPGTLARSGTIALESLALGLAALAVSILLWPADAGLRLPGPHLLWIPVLILATRYGTQGFVISLSAASGMLATVAAFRGDLPSLAVRLERAADLAGLTAAALVGWVASEHQRRRGDLSTRLGAARVRAKADQSAMHELQAALLALRARADRLKFSLTFLRHAAERLENGDPQAAAQAALEISLARLGARAGVVQLFGDQAPHTLAGVGPWTTTGDGAPDLRQDRAVAAALRSRRGARAIDLIDAGPADADLAAPLLDARGQPFGVLAVRGVPFAGASLATLKDLVVVASWLANALDRAAKITPNHQHNETDYAEYAQQPVHSNYTDHAGHAEQGAPADYADHADYAAYSQDDPLFLMPYLEIRLGAEPFLEKALQNVQSDERR